MTGTAGAKVEGACRARYQEQTHWLLQKRKKDSRSHALEKVLACFAFGLVGKGDFGVCLTP